MPRISTKININPKKVFIKDLYDWRGKSVGIMLSKNDALLFSEALIKAAQKTNKIDVTLFPKKKTPVITITYLR